MEQTFYQLFEQYGIYAVLALCTVEGDITLLLAGVLAHNGYFGQFSFLKVYIFGTLGGMIGDTFGYMLGRVFQKTVKDYSFYKMAQPRIERLVDKFGGYAVIVSKYIYGIRVAMVLFNGVGRMPFGRFIFLDFISCSIWALMLASIGYFFSGAVTTIIGDFKQIGIAVFFIILFGVVTFHLIERYLLSQKLEETSPETINRIEEKIHNIEEKLHLTSPQIGPDHPTDIHSKQSPIKQANHKAKAAND